MMHELEALVRAGKFEEAKRNFRKITIKKIPREEALAYANLARRLDLGKLSLRILNPIVRAEKRTGSPATAEEKIEYAASLRSMGAVAEASEILSEIDSRKYPQAALQLAFCLITEWRYETAIPLLQSFVETFKTPSYPMLIGQLNLLAALIYEERLESARRLSSSLNRNIDRSAFPLLYHKSLELAARLKIATGNWDQAVSHLEEARASFGKLQDPNSALLIMKWLAIARSLKSGRVMEELLTVRDRATRLKNWETLRDCDFYIATISGDDDALIRLYFGTPFGSFRRKILESLGHEIELPQKFLWSGDRKPRSSRVFDLVSAKTSDGEVILPPGQSLHRILIALSQDFYRPLPLLSLFSMLFPNEHFHPDTSPNRVHQIIKRFRQWASGLSVPVRIEETSGSYYLGLAGAFSVLVPRDPLPLERRRLELERLRSDLRPERGLFTAKDALRAVGSSLSTVKLLLKWAVETGELETEGRARRARYRWAEKRR